MSAEVCDIRVKGTTMKKLVITGIAAVGFGLALASPAYADQDSFITTLANDGWHGPVDTAVALGQHICSDIAAGVPQATTLQTISDNTTDGVEPKDAAFFYSAAASQLCGH
ncbi:DUF732 domain-containing protein [Mycobacterium sp. ELW1]|nr:DUF732 domain-containing protein [Mycobacterium sp. ELW1]